MFIVNLIPSVFFILVQYYMSRKKKINFAFHISRIFLDLFDISTDFKINGNHVCSMFPRLSQKDSFLKAVRKRCFYKCLHIFKKLSSLVAYKVYVKYNMRNQPNCISKLHIFQSLKLNSGMPCLKTALSSQFKICKRKYL